MPNIQRCCGNRVAPATRIGLLPENIGSAWVSLPQTIMARPRMKILPPIVMMTSPRGDGFFNGLMASRSKITPTTVVTRTARSIAAGSGILTTEKKNQESIPPSMTNSPCAKFMFPVELKIIAKPRPISEYMAPVESPERRY